MRREGCVSGRTAGAFCIAFEWAWAQPRGVVAKHAGLWSRRQRFESARGYDLSPDTQTRFDPDAPSRSARVLKCANRRSKVGPHRSAPDG